MASTSKAAKLKGIGSPIPANRHLLSPHLFTLANYPDSVENGAEATAKWPTCCQIWGDPPCPNPQMDDGKWVSLDDAIEWSVKRGSSESKKLSCDSKAEQEEISAYNKKMDKALRSYLIKVYNVPKGAVRDGSIQTTYSTTNDIFFATSFQTKRKVMWPIFFRLSFREDMKEWKTDIPNTLKTAEYPDDPALLNLKCYNTKSNRGRGYYRTNEKLGLFSCADKIAVLTHGDWSKGSDLEVFPELYDDGAKADYSEFHAVDSDRNNMLGLNLTKTMTNRKNRNQIYIWVPDNRAKPSEQLGLVNWLGGFSRGKE